MPHTWCDKNPEGIKIMKTGSVLKVISLTILMFFINQPANAFTAEVVKKSKLKCMPKTEYNNKGKPVSCELSGVVYVQDRLYVAADWWKNEKPSLFYWDWNGKAEIEGLPEVINTPLTTSTRKFEDMMIFPDSRTILASTSFGHSPLWDKVWVPMNRILYWPSVNHSKVRLLKHESGAGTKNNKRKLLKAVQSRYPGVQFINVEGITAIPGNKLIFGIRQIGTTFKNTSFTSILISSSYKVTKENRYLLTGDFEFIDELDFTEAGLPEVTALSSLEYDFETNKLYALTSYESDDPAESFASYIWVLKPEQTWEGVTYKPEVATNCKGEVLKLHHKAEGLAKIRNNRFVIISDDDLQLTSNGDTRLPEEAYYYIVELEKNNCS